MSRFPAWNIGIVHGIDVTYDVHWLDWDRAQLSVDDDEVITFSSAHAAGFITADGVLREAGDVVYDIENEEWD